MAPSRSYSVSGPRLLPSWRVESVCAVKKISALSALVIDDAELVGRVENTVNEIRRDVRKSDKREQHCQCQ